MICNTCYHIVCRVKIDDMACLRCRSLRDLMISAIVQGIPIHHIPYRVQYSVAASLLTTSNVGEWALDLHGPGAQQSSVK
jgi:hypothetical protein